MRATIELSAPPDDRPVKAERIASAQGIPLNFLENILGELRLSGNVRSHRRRLSARHRDVDAVASGLSAEALRGSCTRGRAG